jgi:hypothetical protein
MIRMFEINRIHLIAFFCLFILSCNQNNNNNETKSEKKAETLNEHLLFIGKDTLKFIPLYDSVVCELAIHQDQTKKFKDSGLTSFETTKRDTIRLANYIDHYNVCGCFILDTNILRVSFIPVSKFMGQVTPDNLISNLEKLEFHSPLGKYTIETLQFGAYCPTGDCQFPWQGNSESPLNKEFKDRIKKHFQTGTYLVLKLIGIKDEKGNYTRIHPDLCWLGK